MTKLAAPIERWLTVAVRAYASDLHLIAGYPPTLRLNGTLSELAETQLEASDLDTLLVELCPPHWEQRLQDERNIDFAFAAPIDEISTRFRVNLFYAAGHLGACFRIIPPAIPDFAWAGFPVELANQLASCRDGMVILTGPTGSGKVRHSPWSSIRLTLRGDIESSALKSRWNLNSPTCRTRS